MKIESLVYDVYVDISGLDCGVPLSRLTQAITVLEPGQRILAVTQKAAMQSDVPAYCRQRGLELVSQGEENGKFYFLISRFKS
jgi:tRNA 2-thiouridine synthesizing protein A